MNTRKKKLALLRLRRLPLNGSLLPYLFNKARNFYYRRTGSEKVAYPSSIMLELTNHCNLACAICPREYRYGREMDKGQMEPALAKKIIDETLPYIDSIGITGLGETLLYPHLNEVIDYINSRKRGVLTSFSTNAVLPDFEKRVTPLIGNIDTIQVSIDGIDDVYESIRKKASFERFDQNLAMLTEKCKNSTTTIMLNMVVTKENYHQMPVIVRYARKRGVAYVHYCTFNITSVTELEMSYYSFFKSEDFARKARELDEVIAEEKEVHVEVPSFEPLYNLTDCMYLWSHFYISWDGFLTPCCAKPFPKELNFGSVIEEKFIDMLNSDKYHAFRRQWMKGSIPKFCRRCDASS